MENKRLGLDKKNEEDDDDDDIIDGGPFRTLDINSLKEKVFVYLMGFACMPASILIQ